MKSTKLFTDLTTVEEFFEYYKDAGKRELKSRLNDIEHKNFQTRKNECDAIRTLLL